MISGRQAPRAVTSLTNLLTEASRNYGLGNRSLNSGINPVVEPRHTRARISGSARNPISGVRPARGRPVSFCLARGVFFIATVHYFGEPRGSVRTPARL